MRLQGYLARNGITQTEFADILSDVINQRRVGRRPVFMVQQQVQRLCSARDRAPRAELMIAIFIATAGAVQPNDFYDLPDLAATEAEGVAA